MGAAIELAVGLHAVADDAAAAVPAHRCEFLNGAFETVEGIGSAAGYNFEGLVVLVAALLAFFIADLPGFLPCRFDSSKPADVLVAILSTRNDYKGACKSYPATLRPSGKDAGDAST